MNIANLLFICTIIFKWKWTDIFCRQIVINGRACSGEDVCHQLTRSRVVPRLIHPRIALVKMSVFVNTVESRGSSCHALHGWRCLCSLTRSRVVAHPARVARVKMSVFVNTVESRGSSCHALYGWRCLCSLTRSRVVAHPATRCTGEDVCVH